MRLIFVVILLLILLLFILKYRQHFSSYWCNETEQNSKVTIYEKIFSDSNFILFTENENNQIICDTINDPVKQAGFTTQYDVTNKESIGTKNIFFTLSLLLTR